MTPDKQWFLDRLQARQTSMRAMASAIGMDVSAVSRLLDGKRALQIEEAAAIASYLGVETAEIMRRAVPAMATPKPEGFSITATVEPDGTIRRGKTMPMPQAIAARVIAMIAASQEKIGDVVAAEVAAGHGPQLLDGATIIYARPRAVDESAIGLLAVVRTEDRKDRLCRLIRIRRSGEADMIDIDGKSQRATITAASPVMAIIP